jgi:hypothetical protein
VLAYLSLFGALLLTSTLAPVTSAPSTPPPRRVQMTAHLGPPPPRLSAAEIQARNLARFPGEDFPPGYDVEEEEPLGNSTIRTVWTSPLAIELDCAHAKREWPGTRPKPSGTLMLNMLTYNEAENLERVLPIWRRPSIISSSPLMIRIRMARLRSLIIRSTSVIYQVRSRRYEQQTAACPSPNAPLACTF